MIKNKVEKILENAKKYAKFVATHKLTALPDYVVFLENEIHIYEFKAGKKIKLSHLQKEAFEKLKNSGLNIKIFVLRPTEEFPPDVNITVDKYC